MSRDQHGGRHFRGYRGRGSAFTDKKLITNDIMYSNYICHKAWFDSQPYSEEKLVDLILDYNSSGWTRRTT